MCPAIVNPAYGVQDQWNEIGYATLSVAARVSGSLKKQAATFTLARDLWKLDRMLRDVLEIVYKAADNPTPPKEPVSVEKIQAAAEMFRKIYGTVDNIYTLSRSTGLTNHRILGTILNSTKVRAEEILDVGDWLATYSDPEADNIINSAVNDLHGGKVYDLADAFK